MPAGGDKQYTVGNVAEQAVVLQGEYLFHVNVQSADGVAELLDRLSAEEAARAYHGPLLPRIEPLVFLNRATELEAVAAFCDRAADSVLYVIGLSGVGKSTVVRASVALRREDTPAVWVGCVGLDADGLLSEIDAGLDLGMRAVLADAKAATTRKVSAVIGAIGERSLIVLDGLEALLDDDGRYEAPAMGELAEAFRVLEHRAKVIVTSRRLPAGIGKATPAIDVLDMRGLAPEYAEALFHERAERAAGDDADLPADVLSRLGGHPKFIELAASAMADLPRDAVAQGLLDATDIGEFVISQVLRGLDERETAVLQAATIFRDAFELPLLRHVVEAAFPGTPVEATVRTLVRRCIFEVAGAGGQGYLVHAVLGEAAGGDATQLGAAHFAAAKYLLEGEIDTEDVTTWDPGLYHLRRAAELAPLPQHIDAYTEFLRLTSEQLGYAGWGNRLVDEWRAVLELPLPTDRAQLMAFGLGVELLKLDRDDEAIAVFRPLSATLEEDGSETAMALKIYVDLRLAEVLAGQAGSTDDEQLAAALLAEATSLADDTAPAVEANDDAHLQRRYCDIRFGIARAGRDYPAMLEWAKRELEWAEKHAATRNEPRSRDSVAEAHFAVGIAETMNGNREAGIEHLFMQLRIKVELKNIPGVAAALFNVAHFLAPEDRGCLFLISDQILEEHGLRKPSAISEMHDAMDQALAAEGYVEHGRKIAETISPWLVPYWERVVARTG